MAAAIMPEGEDITNTECMRCHDPIAAGRAFFHIGNDDGSANWNLLARMTCK